MKASGKAKILALAITVASALVLVGAVAFRGHAHHTDTLVVQFAYPVTSLNPTIYDDWESVFIGNHIYRRLLPDEDKPWVQYLTRELKVDCESSPNTEVQDCESVRISFKPTLFTDCAGRQYSVADIREEFFRLLKSKAWVIPSWQPCKETGDEVCITAKNTPDLERRMRNVNFRFGWLKSTPQDTVFGNSTYCLNARPNSDGSFTTGALIAQVHDSGLPKITFYISQKASDYFNIALYGSKKLLSGKRRNVHAHTPLAYYVVTNPALAEYALPWNSEQTKQIIHRHLVDYEVFFTETPQFMRLAPEGNALAVKRTKVPDGKRKLELVIPNFLPKCSTLAAALNESWGPESPGIAVCGDIITYVVDRVREKKGPWSAFVAGVSPSDPGRDAIRNQYFSPESSESWTYDFPRPAELIYLVGMGQSLVTVDAETVCGIRPNPLGMGDIYVTDLLPCN